MIIRITNIILAFIIFISSSGLIVNKHYCQDELKSIRLFLAAKGCHSEKAEKRCPLHPNDQKKHGEDQGKKGCCEDETQLFKTDDSKLTPSFETELVDIVVFSANLFDLYWPAGPLTDEATLLYLTYRPPIFVNDILSRQQIFRL